MPENNSLRFKIHTMFMDLEAVKKSAPTPPVLKEVKLAGQARPQSEQVVSDLPKIENIERKEPLKPADMAFPFESKPNQPKQENFQPPAVPKPIFPPPAQSIPATVIPPRPIGEVRPTFSKETKTEAGIELRLLPKAEPVIKKPPYKPSGPPIRPVYALGRELETQQKPAGISFLKNIKKIIIGVLAIILLAGGFFLYQAGGLDLIISFFSGTSTGPVQFPQLGVKPPVVVETPQISSLIAAQSVITLDLPEDGQISSGLLAGITDRNFLVGSLHQVILKSGQTRAPLNALEFFKALNIVPPFGFIDSVEQDFMFFVEGGLIKNTFGAAFKIRSGSDISQSVRLANQLSSWEQKFLSDWRILMEIDSAGLAAASQFQNTAIAGTQVRFAVTKLGNAGIYYAIVSSKNILIITTSRDAMQAALESLRNS